MNRRTFRQSLARRYQDGKTSTTSSAGNVGGTTLVDNTLVNYSNNDLKGGEVTLTSGTMDGQTREITAFTAATGTITVAPAFGAPTQVAASTTYELRLKWKKDIYDEALVAAERHARLKRRFLQPWRDQSIVLSPFISEYRLPVDKRVTGTADSGSGLANLKDSTLTETDRFWVGGRIVITAGVGVGDVREVEVFDAENNRCIPSRRFSASLDTTSTYALIKYGPSYIHRAAYQAGIDDWKWLLHNQWDILRSIEPSIFIGPSYLPNDWMTLNVCDDADDWVGSGVAETPTEDKAFQIEGEACINLGVSGVGTATYTHTEGYDLSEYQYVQFPVYLAPGTAVALTSIDLYLYDGTAYYKASFAAAELEEGRWINLGRAIKDMTVSGSPDLSAIDDVRIGLVKWAAGTIAVGAVKIDCVTAHLVPPVLRLEGMRLPAVTEADMEVVEAAEEYAFLYAAANLINTDSKRRDIDPEDAQARYLSMRQEAELALERSSSPVPPDSRRCD